MVIGLPALVLTTTTPLVSGWFEAARERQATGDPYWLYALSNGGSLLALIAYPLLIEPRLGLSAQRGVWAVGYGCSSCCWRSPRRAPSRRFGSRMATATATAHARRRRRSMPPPSTGRDGHAGCCSRRSLRASCRP